MGSSWSPENMGKISRTHIGLLESGSSRAEASPKVYLSIHRHAVPCPAPMPSVTLPAHWWPLPRRVKQGQDPHGFGFDLVD